MVIIGAGMGGCLAALQFPEAKVYEASKSLPTNHKAVLRFRESKISQATGIPFKKVKVMKGLFYRDQFYDLNPALANLYSKKVIGEIQDRSITDLNPVHRWVAPPDFHQILADKVGSRITFDARLSNVNSDYFAVSNAEGQYTKIPRDGGPIVSTIPMHALSKCVNTPIDTEFNFLPITTSRYKVENSNVHQTIYYPDPHISVYRATLTGEDLIIESTSEGVGESSADESLQAVLDSLGLRNDDIVLVELNHVQKYGKIAPIDSWTRRKFILECTINHNVYSLGRYACWTNSLLDDVHDDIGKIKTMIDHDPYRKYQIQTQILAGSQL